MRTTAAIAFALAAIGMPRAADAQRSAPRVFVSVGASGQVSRNDFTPRITFPLFLEQAEITGRVGVGRGARIEGGGGVRIWRSVSAGATISFFRGRGPIEATYSLPYPFLFGDPRVGTGTSTARRTNLDVHIQALVAAFALKSWRVTIEGGPSYTRLSQALATDVFSYGYTYPFDRVSIETADRGKTIGHGFGGHAGATFAHRLHSRTDVYGQLRWSSTKAKLEPRGAENNLKVQTGGVQAGGGLRFALWR